MLAIEKVNTSALAIDNTTVQTAVNDIAFAVQTANTAYGIVQYNCYIIQQQFKDAPKGATIGGFYKYEDFCKSAFGIERSQAYNLAKSGRLIRKVRTSETTFGYVDCFTLTAAGLVDKVLKNEIVDISNLKPFSFTALTVIAEKWGNLTAEEITAKLHENGIGSNMTVAEIKSIINPAKLTTKKKSSQLDKNGNNENGNNENGNNENGNNENGNNENGNKKTIGIALSQEEWIKLKVELIQFTEKPIKGKKIDKITEFVNKINEILK